MRLVLVALSIPAPLICCAGPELPAPPPAPPASEPRMDAIRLSDDGRRFVHSDTGEPFLIWGVNYDHDSRGRLLEDYWHEEWAAVEEDFAEMQALGANAVRIHLQLGRFMATPEAPDPAQLERLARLVRLAERHRLYLDLTGLGCYHRQDVPLWYDALDESDRWTVQARFWEAVAETCAGSPVVFCYDLMNEPILPGAGAKETDWLAGDFAGKHFVQRIALDLGERTREQVARDWIGTMLAAIRKHDSETLVTVGVIPWAHVWPQARPIFYSPEAGEQLDFVSVHFYPQAGEVDRALAALAVYDLGKPLVVEEMFPLKCSTEELDAFVEGSRGIAEGWMGFYWGTRLDESAGKTANLADAITRDWLQYFRSKTPDILGLQSHHLDVPVDGQVPRR